MLEFFDKLEKSSVFGDWKKANEDCFLCSCFSIIEDKENSWQFDYYNKSLNKITSFKVDNDIEVVPNDDVFNDGSSEIKEVDLKSPRAPRKSMMSS